MRYLVLLFFFCSSCTAVYIPNTRNLPMIDHAGEVTSAVKIGSPGFEGQLAFSPVNRLGLMANGLYKNSATSEIDEDFQKHEYLEFGVGYYESFAKWGVFEVYGGYGKGEGSAQDKYIFKTHTDFATGKYQRYFIQPGVAYKREFIETGVCFRVSRVEFYEFESNNFNNIKLSNTIVEPAILVRGGGKHLKMEAQAGFNVPVYSSEFQLPAFTLSLGIQVRLDFNKKNRSSPTDDNGSPETDPQP